MGDEIFLKNPLPVKLEGNIAGTDSIESVEIFNKFDRLNLLRTYSEDSLGKRIKIFWSGAEVRGRDRMVNWNGKLRVEDNRIIDFTSINFWNPDKPIRRISDQELSWESITTGGYCGLLLTLNDHTSGSIIITTTQGDLDFNIKSIGLEPHKAHFGGIEKQIEIYRLPDTSIPKEITFSYQLDALQHRMNPIYLRVKQLDGHIAWTSPVYIEVI